MQTRLLIYGTIVTLLAVAGCSEDNGPSGPDDPGDPAPATASVTTSTSPPPRFIPRSTRVRVGGTVTWENTSPAPNLHNVVWSSGGFAASPDLATGETHEVTFPQAGTFDYQCLIHAGMTGEVEVE